MIDVKATVAARLEEAGAVLVAKLSLGALAMGDQWFGGRTRSPWDPRTGSSGSSAGSASAVAAGLVGFAIGSETLGSIVSPCRACGASGLRPTFGRVSRHGCMTLSWSMDKLGPIARSIEDCALVFDAIHGADGLDWAAVDQPFDWPPKVAFDRIKVGYIEERDRPTDDREELKVLRKLGFELVPITLPDELPVGAITLMLGTEAAAAFDEITRKHITEGLNTWPNTFRNGQFVPAVEYLRAARVRTKLMRAMAERMAAVDLYVGSGQDLSITNLTGHPTVVFPMGFRDRDGRSMPGSVTLTGRLYDEATLMAVARAFQQATGDHRKRPPLEVYLAEEEKRKGTGESGVGNNRELNQADRGKPGHGGVIRDYRRVGCQTCRARIAFERKDLAAYTAIFSAGLQYHQLDGRTIGRDQLMRNVHTQFKRLFTGHSIRAPAKGYKLIISVPRPERCETTSLATAVSRCTMQLTTRCNCRLGGSP